MLSEPRPRLSANVALLRRQRADRIDDEIDVLLVDVDRQREAHTRRPERRALDDPVALAKFAEIQERDGAGEEAIKTYEKIVAGNPLFGSAMRRLTVLYSQRSTDEPKAYDVAQKAYQAFPQDPEVAKALGILSYRREYYPRAADLLRQAALKHTDDAEVLYYLGAAHHQLKQRNECKTALERALGLNLAPALADKAKPTLAECAESASP